MGISYFLYASAIICGFCLLLGLGHVAFAFIMAASPKARRAYRKLYKQCRR